MRSEPAEFVDRVDDGDLLATALTERDQLASDLAELKQQAAKEQQQLRRELDQLTSEHEALGHRYDWAEQRINEARTRYDRLEQEHQELRADHNELLTMTARQIRLPQAAIEPGQLPMSRTQRRQAERNAKRRPR